MLSIGENDSAGLIGAEGAISTVLTGESESAEAVGIAGTAGENSVVCGRALVLETDLSRVSKNGTAGVISGVAGDIRRAPKPGAFAAKLLIGASGIACGCCKDSARGLEASLLRSFESMTSVNCGGASWKEIKDVSTSGER